MKKEIGFIGLGRMGLQMALRLHEAGYQVVGFDQSETARTAASAVGISVVSNYTELLCSLSESRVIWCMVPSQYVDEVLKEITSKLAAGDTIIDGGNSFYKDSLRRHAELKAAQLQFLDCGSSGGVSGARSGAALMVGGPEDTFSQHEAVFAALAASGGYARVGAAGAGHFVKMIHNGIEYGMMGAIAEGMSVLHEQGTQFRIDLNAVLKPYEHESVIASKLITWLRQAYDEGQIERIKGVVPTGETEQEMEHITTLAATPILKAALAQRQSTRTAPSYVGKLIAAMRNQFGGHQTIEK